MREFSRAVELDKQLYLSQYFKTMMNAKWDTPEQREAVHAGLSLTSQVNPRFAPAYVQAAILELFDGHEDRALALSRKAEDLEPSRAGYHLLTGEILLRLKREKDAAEIARFVAERWRGPDHNEAVALWNRIPEASRPPDATVIEETEEQSKVAEGKIQSVTCDEKSKKVVTLQHGNRDVDLSQQRPATGRFFRHAMVRNRSFRSLPSRGRPACRGSLPAAGGQRLYRRLAVYRDTPGIAACSHQ